MKKLTLLYIAFQDSYDLNVRSRPTDVWSLNPAVVELSVQLARLCSVPFNFQRPLVIIMAKNGRKSQIVSQQSLMAKIKVSLGLSQPTPLNISPW